MFGRPVAGVEIRFVPGRSRRMQIEEMLGAHGERGEHEGDDHRHACNEWAYYHGLGNRGRSEVR